MLHDISHTAFSHAVDFVFTSQEQDYHEQLKPLMLDRPDVASALARFGHSPCEFYDDSIYPLLEQPIPWLCADRLDYFLRDGLTCGVVPRSFVQRILSHVTVVDSRSRSPQVEIAREAVVLFEAMNHDWWAGPVEAFIYNEFADALREGMRIGVLKLDDLMTDDAVVLAKLEGSQSPLIADKLKKIRQLRPGGTNGYLPRIFPKERWLDPSVQTNGSVHPLSSLTEASSRH